MRVPIESNAASNPVPRRSAFRAVATGVFCIFGGEALCLLGPMAYERQVHLICHAILYGGVGLVVIGAVLHWMRPETH